MPRTFTRSLLVCLMLSTGCGKQASTTSAALHTQALALDARKSLAVTDNAIRKRFTLKRVLKRILRSAGDSRTPSELFAQWMDTFNASPGFTNNPAFPHCDDAGATINGFPIECPRTEGDMADPARDPFRDDAGDDAWVATGLFNRIDLAPKNGAHCGEYRMVFARVSGITGALFRRFAIFEAVLPNPHPECGIAACKPIADFWAKLSSIPLEKRVAELERFYFKGLDGFAPVVRPKHYAAGAGQIRTNMFTHAPGDGWQLREFRIQRLESGEIVIAPTFVANNPFGMLFNDEGESGENGSGLHAAFQNHFVTQIAGLASNNVLNIGMSTPIQFNGGESDASGPNNNYAAQLDPDGGFANAIADHLQLLGKSYLTPSNIAARATANSCGGCHQISNGVDLGAPNKGELIWPSSLGFVHVAEVSEPAPEGGERNIISPALTDVFLPHRLRTLRRLLRAPALCAADTTGVGNLGQTRFVH